MTSNNLEEVWPEWKIEKQIGRGSFGAVYQVVRKENDLISRAAIKVISIPQDSSEMDSLRAEGLDLGASRTYLKNIVDDFINEIRLMEPFKGIQNIVSIEDYKVIEKKDEVGWDIFIRMELLTPFHTYISDKKLTEQEVIKLGCDICTALDICAKRNIIHRDIKPENIFINSFGDFKLGDFGTARKMENLFCGMSQKGTYNYMAPEAVAGGEYDGRVDVYSLGLVLYRLMNENRLPFISERQILSPSERQEAFERRIHGEELPAPCNASKDLADVILKACAFRPEKRYANACEMRKALQQIGKDTSLVKGEVKKMNKVYLSIAIALMMLVSLGGGIGLGVGMTDLIKPYVQDEKEEIIVPVSDIADKEELAEDETTNSVIEESTEVETTNPVIEESTEDAATNSVIEESTEAETVIQNPHPGEPAFEFEYLDVRPTIFCNRNTGEGCNASGEPVERCLQISYDFSEEMHATYTSTLTCSWGHVVNGTYGQIEEFLEYEDHKNGRTSAAFGVVSKGPSGKEQFLFFLCLPDDPSIEGPQSATLFVGSSHVTINFDLIYDGGYVNGNGWKIKNIKY